MPLDRVFGQPFDVLVGHAVGRRERSCFRSLGLLGSVVLFVATVILGTVDGAKAASILLGSDYLTTLPGTFFDFPGIGVVPLEGRLIAGVMLSTPYAIARVWASGVNARRAKSVEVNR